MTDLRELAQYGQARGLPERIEEQMERHRQRITLAREMIEQLGTEAVIDALEDLGFEVDE